MSHRVAESERRPMSRRDERRDQILQAALQVIGRHGMKKTTMEDIAEAAHMRAASLYYYFKGKEEVFSAAIRALGETSLAQVRAEVQAADSGERKLIAYMKTRQAVETQANSNFDLSSEIITELMPLVQEAATEILESDLEFIAQILEQGVDDGSFMIDGVMRTASALQACFMGTNFACKTYDNFDDQIVFPTLFELLLHGLVRRPTPGGKDNESLNHATGQQEGCQ